MSSMLIAYLDQVKATRFRPGNHDCAIFAAKWVEIVTGKDLTQGLIGKYRSIEEGKAALREMGFSDHIDLAAQHFDKMHPAFAQIGDVAVIENRAFGIVAGERVFVLRPDGLGHLPLSAAEKVFRLT